MSKDKSFGIGDMLARINTTLRETSDIAARVERVMSSACPAMNQQLHNRSATTRVVYLPIEALGEKWIGGSLDDDEIVIYPGQFSYTPRSPWGCEVEITANRCDCRVVRSELEMVSFNERGQVEEWRTTWSPPERMPRYSVTDCEQLSTINIGGDFSSMRPAKYIKDAYAPWVISPHLFPTEEGN